MNGLEQKREYTKKPPLGLMPKYAHDRARIMEIRDAIHRYIIDENDYEIPIEWVEEYNNLIIGARNDCTD